MVKKSIRFSKAILYCLIITLAYYALNNMLDIGIVFVLGDYFGVKFEFLASPLATLILLTFVGILFRSEFIYLKVKKDNFYFKNILLIIIIGFVLRILRDPIYMFPQISGILNIPKGNNIFLNMDNMIWHLTFVIHTVILIPIVEEIVFRRVMLKKLSDINPLVAILLSSFFFALIHVNPLVIPGSLLTTTGAFFFGIVASIIYLATKNLIYPIILHIVTNLFSYLIKINQFDYFEIQRNLNFGIFYWLIVFACLVLCVLLLKKTFYRYIGNGTD